MFSALAANMGLKGPFFADKPHIGSFFQDKDLEKDGLIGTFFTDKGLLALSVKLYLTQFPCWKYGPINGPFFPVKEKSFQK